jgi:hypothetical protein
LGGSGGVSSNCLGSGGGGSSYISGMEGVLSVKQYSNSTSYIYNEHIHSTGHTFFHIEVYNGSETFPSPHRSLETGHQGHGCLRIKYANECSFKFCKFQFFHNLFHHLFIILLNSKSSFSNFQIP